MLSYFHPLGINRTVVLCHPEAVSGQGLSKYVENVGAEVTKQMPWVTRDSWWRGSHQGGVGEL